MQIKCTADTLLEVLSCLKAVGLANKPWETRTWSFILQQAKLQHIWSHMDHQHHSRQRQQMFAWYDQWWCPPYTEKHNSLPGRISLDRPCALNDLLYCYSPVSVMIYCIAIQWWAWPKRMQMSIPAHLPPIFDTVYLYEWLYSDHYRNLFLHLERRKCL